MAETHHLREQVRHAAAQLAGRVWPNGLGFDARGWEYMLRDDGTWSAVRRETDHHSAKYGTASSPVRAKANALYPHLEVP